MSSSIRRHPSAQAPTGPSPFTFAITVALAATLALTAGACARASRASSGSTDTPPPAPGAAAAASVGRLNLAERLARESALRPAGALRVEAAAAALAAGGVPMGPLHQVLAGTIGARYCTSARSAGGAGVAICEFTDGAEAAHGLAYSRATFDRLIPGRRLAQARNLVLTVTPADAGGRFDAEAARATAVFAAL